MFPLNLDFFLGIETFKIVESLHHYHDKSLRQDEFVRNSAKTNEKHYTIPDSKRFFFSNTVPISHFGRHLSVFIETGLGWTRYLLLSISMKKANSCHIQRLGIYYYSRLGGGFFYNQKHLCDIVVSKSAKTEFRKSSLNLLKYNKR